MPSGEVTENMGLGFELITWFPALPLTSPGTLGKLLTIPGLAWFSHL